MTPTLRLTLPGTLRQSVVGTSIKEPTPDMDPDLFILPFLQNAVRQAAPEWVVSDERFGVTSTRGRGQWGGEDIIDAAVQVGTPEQHILIRRHYSEPEQEMFPTARREFRWYTVFGLPTRRHLAVHADREWIAGKLTTAALTLELKLPVRLTAKITTEFREAFESHE